VVKLIYKDEAYKVIGACMEVHRVLGSGFLEPVYQEALGDEMDHRELLFRREAELRIIYKAKTMDKRYFADFICYDKLLLELKSVKELLREHEAQVFNYLKATGLKLGLLVNFGKPSLEYKRIVCAEYF
jgi:GxxExxY protein